MDSLRVRLYNVGFGDAILVSVPDRGAQGTVTRHLLIDVGNVLRAEENPAGGADDVFEPIVRDILAVLDGRPLDLYIMTHEHLDHVQGLLAASRRWQLTVPTRYAWLTASAAEDYYDHHPNARRKRLEVEQALRQIAALHAVSPDLLGPALAVVLANNNPQSTADCVAFLRALKRPGNAAATTTYVSRGASISGRHPFKEAKLRLWAPEEDTSSYYPRLVPMALGMGVGAGGGAPAAAADPLPPPGVDAGAFYALVDIRRSGVAENLLAIDKAANNSSVVICLEWRGWKLLFSGDAEQKSWQMMMDQGVLQPVHFLKVGHHGSWNGTPPLDLLERILPAQRPDNRPRRAAVSTCLGVYEGVPDTDTLTELGHRCDQVVRVDEAAPLGGFVDILFDG
jgi:beta-lactamase superfamily II metal-dependent hydrolase